MSADPAILIKDLDFEYENSTPILENVNLRVEAGQSGCIVGPNGGGKTTLLKLLLGLLSPSAGSIRIFGLPPQEARAKIGYMPQYHQLDAAFPVTVFEVALMGRMRRKMWGRYSRQDREIAMNALSEVGVDALADRSFSALWRPASTGSYCPCPGMSTRIAAAGRTDCQYRPRCGRTVLWNA